MPYAILRFQKRKAGGVAACERHNERKKEAYKSNPDIDMERSKNNYHLIAPPKYTYKKEINRMVAEAGCRTRKDSVMMVETLITASPEFMNQLPPEEQKAYFQTALDFISERVGKQNILSAVVHMDERTPHMHLCFVPITPDNKLSAKAILGNQKSLSEWQTAYHERMSSRWNQLERGQSSMETKRKHVPTWLYKLGGRLTYREKDEKETEQAENQATLTEELAQQFKGYRNPYSPMLIESKNIIFRGAPGTGKSYLAKEIAADIISNGYFDDYTMLTLEQKKQVEFVQFHPSFDYSDFIEGLRPKVNDDGSMGFELQDGIFKRFITRARKNYEDSQKSTETIEKEVSVKLAIEDFFSGIDFGTDEFKTINGNSFHITSVDDKHISISIPGNASINKLTLNIDEIAKMLESDAKFEKIKDVTTFFGKQFATQGFSYDFAIYKAIQAKKIATSKATARQEELKKYIFIIDEINRGEVSKIFGELFFAIDPGYRGRAGEISTQYANLHSDPDEKLFIPENVYIIGTMNDIDRSVDSFDFAMRRRFRFVELKADERLEMLATLENEELETEAIRRMAALNKEIASVEDLNVNYQIGASYFLKLKTLSFDQLWTDYLQPLLQEYIQGMYNEGDIMKKFAKAYGYQKLNENRSDEAV